MILDKLTVVGDKQRTWHLWRWL